MTIHRIKFTEKQLAKSGRLLSARTGNQAETPTAAGLVSSAVTGVVYLRTPERSIELTPVQCRELETALRNHRIVVANERKADRMVARRINQPVRVK